VKRLTGGNVSEIETPAETEAEPERRPPEEEPPAGTEPVEVEEDGEQAEE
jgi:hypothetical protein